MKKTTTWAVLGSLVVNLAIGTVIALVFSGTPVAQATELPQAPTTAPTKPIKAPAKDGGKKDDYLTAVRMGWAAG